jgi:hypothetical protein
MSRWFKTSEVLIVLGVPYYTLRDLWLAGRFRKPRKDASGDLVWTDADIRRAQKAL